MGEILYKEEAYEIIGACMEVHNELGHGFSEIVYKDALELIFLEKNIYYEREKEYMVYFRGRILPHKFYADYVVYDKIIVEIKCVKAFADEHISQAINYLKVSNNRLAILINFARTKLEYQRVLY